MGWINLKRRYKLLIGFKVTPLDDRYISLNEIDNELKLEIMNEFACYNIKPIFFSSLIHENIQQLIYELVKMIQ